MLASCAALWLCSGEVNASGFDSARFGGELGGHAAAPTPFAVYYNPAALGATRKFQLAIDLTLALHAQTFDRKVSDTLPPKEVAQANTGRASLFNALGGPALAASLRFGDLALGAGAVSPFSGIASFRGSSRYEGNLRYPGAQDGVARFHLIEGSFSVVYFTSALSYTIRPLGLSIGAGANLVHASIDVVRATTAAADDDVTSEGRVQVDTQGWVGSFSAGVMWEALTDVLWLAGSYQAPPGLYDGMVLEGKTRTDLGGSISSTRVDLHQSLPDSVRLAVRYRPVPRLELRLFGDYMRWSMFERQCLTRRGRRCDVRGDGSVPPGSGVVSNFPRNFQDAFGVRMGTSYWLAQRLELFAGAGYDGNAIPDQTLEPSIMDGHDFAGALGARVGLTKRLSLALSYTHLLWLPRHTAGKSELFEQAPPTRLPNAGGDYRQWVGIFNAFVEVSL